VRKSYGRTKRRRDSRYELSNVLCTGNGGVSDNTAAKIKKMPLNLFTSSCSVKYATSKSATDAIAHAFKEAHKKIPNDLLFKYFCRCDYTNKEGQRVLTPSPQACYYFHFKLDCARKVEPAMERTDIIVHDELRKCLKNQHKQRLRSFGLQV
jgi:hypothetical protein